jgi:hypothetical protein
LSFVSVSGSLPILIQFFVMFYNDKPVDWLLDHVVTTKICKLDQASIPVSSDTSFKLTFLVLLNIFY